MNQPPSHQTAKPAEASAPSVQADLLGEAMPLQPPVPPAHQPTKPAVPAADAGMPKPAEDENQPGFTGERNLPHL